MVGGKYRDTPDQVLGKISFRRWRGRQLCKEREIHQTGNRRKTKMPWKPNKESFQNERKSHVIEVD